MRQPQPANSQKSFRNVTETAGQGATHEQLSMLHTRYSLACDISEDKDVLELACAAGVGLGCLACRARSVVGADIEQTNIAAAQRHYGHRVQVVQCDAENLPFDDKSFDVVILLEAIYFLPDARRFVAEAARILRDGGTLYVCASNPERADFNPCLNSTEYPTARGIKQLLEDAGFGVELQAGFPVRSGGLKRRFLGCLQAQAAKWRLIPRTMDGKARLKRLLFGKLKPIPAELEISEEQCEKLTSITHELCQPIIDYKVIYALGTLQSRDKKFQD